MHAVSNVDCVDLSIEKILLIVVLLTSILQKAQYFHCSILIAVRFIYTNFRTQYTRSFGISILSIQRSAELQGPHTKRRSCDFGRQSKWSTSRNWNLPRWLGKYEISYSLQQNETRSVRMWNTSHFGCWRISWLLGARHSRHCHRWTWKRGSRLLIVARSKSIPCELFRRVHWLGSIWLMDHWRWMKQIRWRRKKIIIRFVPFIFFRSTITWMGWCTERSTSCICWQPGWLWRIWWRFTMLGSSRQRSNSARRRSRRTRWWAIVCSSRTSWKWSYSRQTHPIAQCCVCTVWWHRTSTRRVRSFGRLQSTMDSNEWQSNSTTSCSGRRNCRRRTIVCWPCQPRRISHYWKSATITWMPVHSICGPRSGIPVVRDFDHQLKMNTNTSEATKYQNRRRMKRNCWNDYFFFASCMLPSVKCKIWTNSIAQSVRLI